MQRRFSQQDAQAQGGETGRRCLKRFAYPIFPCELRLESFSPKSRDGGRAGLGKQSGLICFVFSLMGVFDWELQPEQRGLLAS